jgi:hypothetical protein
VRAERAFAAAESLEIMRPQGIIPGGRAMIGIPGVALLALSALLSAQDPKPRTELPISAPTGWELKEQDSTIVLTPKDLEAGKVYSVLAPGLPQKLGTVRKVLEVAKGVLTQFGEFKPANEPAGAKTRYDWEFEVVIGPLTKNGKTLMAEAVGLKKGEKEGILLILSDSVPTMQKYADTFNAMVHLFDAPVPAPAPPAPAAGTVDLIYTVPEGWTSTPMGPSVVLSWSNEATKGQFQNLVKYQFIILPSQPLKDGLRKTYHDLWDGQVGPLVETSVTPYPMLRRLKSGALCAFDLADNAKYKNGQNPGGPLGVALYLLARGNRFVPMLGLFVFRDKGLSDVLEKFMESAKIPNASDDPIATFAPAEVVGTWTYSSASLANYVRNGQVVGDASMSCQSELRLGADGTFKFRTVYTRSSVPSVFDDQGNWTIDDVTLVLKGKKTDRYRLDGVGKDPKDGDVLVLSAYTKTAADAQLNLGDPRGYFQSTTYKKKP